MPDEPKPGATTGERFLCWACGWDSMWPAVGGCYVCLRERLKRGHAAGRVVTDDEGRVITDDDGQLE
jgi:hypothetical protein